MATHYKLLFISVLIFLFGNTNVLANDPVYIQRQQSYINVALTNTNSDVITIQAYKGIPVDSSILNTILRNLLAKSTADFDIVKLIRVLEFSHGEYDSLILPVLRTIPFWLESNETNREYWSENHMIMWMSSDWLLHEKYGKVIDSTLEKRLRHYLHLKVDYGFYEFFSSVYAPYCLSGLLNLADFSQDAEIKDLAAQASQKLLKEFMTLSNDKGVFFPASGRNYPGKFETAYGQNHNNLIYLLTGKGEIPFSASHAGSFLATSALEVSDVTNSWSSVLNVTFTLGHTLQDGISNINNTQSPKDKVIFQWSSGAYFDPLVATSTFQLVKDLNLWGHFEFADFAQFSFLPSSLAPVAAELASSISKSSGLYNPTIKVFKNKSVTLSSIQDFWKGKVGYQEWPVVVNAGTSAVYTLSGKPDVNFAARAESHINTHLPYVQQKDNVALVMYRPEKGLALFGYKGEKLDVAFHWQNDKFDEIREDGNWILGREGNGYVAVRRSCTGEINGVRACDNPDGQTWVYMVGNSDMYGSFDAFEQKILQSVYEEKWYFNTPTLQWVYYAKIVVDGKTLEYAWNGDIFSGPTRVTAIKTNKNDVSTAVYPNPAKDNFTVDVSAFRNQKILVRIVNINGEEVYNEIVENNNADTKNIEASNWSAGMYFILVESEKDKSVQKVMISK
ncbi:MAG: T9SS type A sorting domain-containing protein [Chitinophagales bacterium]